ncbi:MAG TPA: nucleotidyl transferase AbiEii/AbiGii toxin family protein [Candidatus Moranbacteria bacterium]|nr:nucleotidyl transferase AbiEii/AbiGii toxin family protein [Candidatus Moranbacteria bacterium]
MLSLNEIKKYYPNLQGFERGILREYLQYKILEIIFKSKFGKKLSFLGGTAIRICYSGGRFSEDLDFDNFGLSQEEFGDMSKLIQKELQAEGYNVEYRNTYKMAYHSYFKFKDILFEEGLSPMENEKIMIQIDTVSEDVKYSPEIFMLSKFDVTKNIKLTSADIILSKKIGAVFGRKNVKGRDFYDIVFLRSFTDFNYEYLKEKFGIKNQQDLKKKLLEKIADLDLKKLARDIEPFLVKPDEKARVVDFREYVEQVL